MDLTGVFIRNILFPVMEKAKGNRIRKYLGELRSHQDYSARQLKQLQQDKLSVLLLHCIKTVPAYKSMSSLESKIRENPFEALNEFPVLTREAFRERSETYISDNADKTKLVANLTGGSTGAPVKFYHDRKTVEYYEAARWRGLSWHNIRVGDRCAMIWGAPKELSLQKSVINRLKERYLKNRIIISAFSLDPASIRQYVDRIRKFRPKYIYGYASALYAFSVLMLKEGLKLDIKLSAVVSTSETLFDYQRESMQKAFECIVVSEYGARDGGIIAYECAKGSMHISADNLIMETIDPITGEQSASDVTGAVLVTDLNNFSMPRLRYRLGDLAVLSDKKCECGMGLPVLSKLQGREEDIFLAMDGRFIHTEFFTFIARSLDSIKSFRLQQHSPDKVTLTVVKSEKYDQREIDSFAKRIIEQLGKIELKIVYADNIPLTGSGKFRFTKREFPLEIFKTK